MDHLGQIRVPFIWESNQRAWQSYAGNTVNAGIMVDSSRELTQTLREMPQ